jgi:hypothetical protein
MQISIQSLEIEVNKTPYRFIVKKMYNTSRNELVFHCWAPEDNMNAKALIDNEVLMFEWDKQRAELKPNNRSPLSDQLKQAIESTFQVIS